MKTVSQEKVIYGTQVNYRPVGSPQVLEKTFLGDNHFAEATKFCKDHVAGLTDEEYAKLPANVKQRYVARTSITPSDMANATRLWMRKMPLWNYHTLQPFSIDRNNEPKH
jgi:hypothetical protein